MCSPAADDRQFALRLAALLGFSSPEALMSAISVEEWREWKTWLTQNT